MGKKEFEQLISGLFLPVGFKKKGNYWIKTQAIITKMIYLQKSQFGNSFYINYGYILNAIPLGDLRMHVFGGFGSIVPNENARIKELLNLENNITDEVRISELNSFISALIIKRFEKVNSEVDILNELKMRAHLNDLPGVVKEYFHLD